MKFIKTDLGRIFTEPMFYISTGLNLLLLFGSFFWLISSGKTANLYDSAHSLALPFTAPVLAAMPYSVMIMQEKETRYGMLMTIKLRKNGYELLRLLTCGFSGAATLFLPRLMLFIVCAAMGAAGNISNALAELILPVTFGFGYAAFSYVLTFVNRQRYVPLIMPQVIYLLCIYAFPYLKLQKIYPPLDIAPAIYGGGLSPERFIIPLLLTSAAALLTIFGKRGERR